MSAAHTPLRHPRRQCLDWALHSSVYCLLFQTTPVKLRLHTGAHTQPHYTARQQCRWTPSPGAASQRARCDGRRQGPPRCACGLWGAATGNARAPAKDQEAAGCRARSSAPGRRWARARLQRSSAARERAGARAAARRGRVRTHIYATLIQHARMDARAQLPKIRWNTDLCGVLRSKK